jgi:transcriptional regulator with XRE-family HTH domain
LHDEYSTLVICLVNIIDILATGERWGDDGDEPLEVLHVRKTPTPRVRALGRALRKARESRELKLREFAGQIQMDPSLLSRFENGERVPKVEQVAQILTKLDINGEQYSEIVELAYGAEESSWVASSLPAHRQQLAAFLDFEQYAKNIVEVSPLLIPGLLQTDNYVRALMASGRWNPGELATRTAVRIGRRQVLTRTPDPVRFTALVGETALHHSIGDARVMAEQLKHVVHMARHSNIDIRLIRFNSGWSPALGGQFTLFEFEHDAVVFLENHESGLFLHETADVMAYKKAVDTILNAASTPRESVNYISKIAERLAGQIGN